MTESDLHNRKCMEWRCGMRLQWKSLIWLFLFAAPREIEAATEVIVSLLIVHCSCQVGLAAGQVARSHQRRRYNATAGQRVTLVHCRYRSLMQFLPATTHSKSDIFSSAQSTDQKRLTIGLRVEFLHFNVPGYRTSTVHISV